MIAAASSISNKGIIKAWCPDIVMKSAACAVIELHFVISAARLLQIYTYFRYEDFTKEGFKK